MHNEEENYSKMYRLIKEHFDIDDDTFRQDPKYINLLEGLEKKKELEAILEQRKT